MIITNESMPHRAATILLRILPQSKDFERENQCVSDGKEKSAAVACIGGKLSLLAVS